MPCSPRFEQTNRAERESSSLLSTCIAEIGKLCPFEVKHVDLRIGPSSALPPFLS